MLECIRMFKKYFIKSTKTNGSNGSHLLCVLLEECLPDSDTKEQIQNSIRDGVANSGGIIIFRLPLEVSEYVTEKAWKDAVHYHDALRLGFLTALEKKYEKQS